MSIQLQSQQPGLTTKCSIVAQRVVLRQSGRVSRQQLFLDNSHGSQLFFSWYEYLLLLADHILQLLGGGFGSADSVTPPCWSTTFCRKISANRTICSSL